MTTPKHLRVDDSQPRTLIITVFTIVSVLVLLVLKPIFDSYYDAMYSAEKEAKVGAQPTTELDAIHERERVLLDQTGVPMPRVFSQLARGRQGGPASIAPQPSTDIAPIKGWSSLPSFVHTADAHVVDPAIAAAAAAAAEAARVEAEAAAAAAAAAAVPAPDAVAPVPTPTP